MTEPTTASDAAAATERISRSRTVTAPPEAVWAVLTDPTRHHETEPGDWVRDALDTELLTEVGQVFGIRMFHERAGGDYVVHNTVTALEPERTVEWGPGDRAEDGVVHPGGWRWRYDLAPDGAGTSVTLTYDWSRAPAAVREHVPLPAVGGDFLDESLATLEQAVTR